MRSGFIGAQTGLQRVFQCSSVPTGAQQQQQQRQRRSADKQLRLSIANCYRQAEVDRFQFVLALAFIRGFSYVAVGGTTVPEGVCTLKTCDPTITSITLNYTSKFSRLS